MIPLRRKRSRSLQSKPQRVHSRHESSSLRGHVPDHRASIPPPKPLLHSKTAPNLETTLPTRSYDRIDPLCAAVAARIAEILEPEGETVPDEPLPVIEPVNRDQPQFRRRFRSRSSRDAALIAERRAEEVPVPPVHQVEQSKTNETEPAKANHLGFPLLPPLPKKHDHDDCIDHLPAEVSSPPTLQTLSASPTPPTSKTLAPSPPEHFRKPPLPYTPYATELNKPPRATDHTAEILISDSSIGSGAAEDARASHVDDKAHERSSAQEDSVSSCQPEATLAEWPRIGDKAHETPSDRQEGLLSHQPEGMSGEAPPIGDQPRSSGIQVQGSDRDWEQEFKTRESSMRTKLHTAETEVDQARQRQELAESALRDGKQEWETRERDWVAKVGKANRETEDAMNKLEHAEKKEKELEQLLAEATKRTELAEKKAQEAQDEVQNVTASASNLAATHMKAIETAEAAHAAALAAANRDFNERMVKADRRAEIAEARVGDAERRVAEAVHEVEKAQEAEAAMKKKATDVENTLLEVEVKTREKRILLKEMDAKVKDLTKKLEQESGGRKLAEVRAAVAEAAIERRDIALSSLAAASQKRYLELTTVWMQLVELTDNLVYAEQYIEWLQNAGKNGSTRMSMPAMADPGIYGGTKRSLNGLSMDSRASATTSRGSVVSSLMSEQDSGRSATGTASHIVPVNSENEAGEGGDAIFAAQRGTTSERETKSTISRMSSTSERERERAAADAAPLPTSLFTVPSSEFSEGKSSRSDGTQSQLEISASHGSVRGSQKWALPSNLARMGSGTPSMSDIKAVSGRFLEMRKKDAKRPANNMQSNDSVNVMLSNTSIKVVDFRTKQ
ncbi:hypothetical protein M427DRAFT_255184 [Gonapodya prolifera JEL478]|uniref:Uncharacterized protein n=1 Tax=Gonapodya prolifera (strain JEL478) TaxID=1344416 RepID=A0A139ALE9_GONPJ|nr:hypothetical protein M427DRAFT_255184 [Gonapodya prolifera JEL478]|eukprot:KXS17611.1 hypothetical protein M427DRAFT_255184 [Gonapodya prolifera JEL478]